MAVKLTQMSSVGALQGDKANVQPVGLAVPHYDATTTTKSAAIGSAIQLDATTTAIIFYEDEGTGFTWGIVAAEGDSLPANSPEWRANGDEAGWSIGKSTSAARWFKTAALS